MQKLSGNRGEWSEIYIFLKLICDGKLYIADKNIERLPDTYLRIIKIIREEYAGEKYEYFPGDSVRIFRNGTDTGEIVDISEFREAKETLWRVLQNSPQGSRIECEKVEKFLNKIHISKLKAPAVKQNNYFGGTQDIVLQVQDYRTGILSEMGFSCKADFSSKATLFNASKEHTNFVYRIKGNITDRLMEKFNNTFAIRNKINKETGKTEEHKTIAIQERIKLLKNYGCEPEYYDTSTENVRRNLVLSGGMEMPGIIGNMLKAYYFDGEGKSTSSSIEYALEYVVRNNVAQYPFDNIADIYRRKTGKLLYDMFTGMRLSSAWNGKSSVNGGYISVQNDGNILALHSCISDDFMEFLISQLGFESPSASRHQYMEIYKNNGQYFLKFNLQIRFK